MTKLDIYEERLAIHTRDHGICRSCGLPVSVNDFTVAHKIANTVANRKRFGAEVIDHPLNKATTHAGICNDLQNCGFRPDQCREIVQAIKDSKDAM